MQGKKTHPAAVTLSGKAGWVGGLLVQGASDIACTDHDVRAPALPIFEQKTHLRPEVGVLGKEAMFMFELRAAKGDMDGEEGVNSIRWASGLLIGRRGGYLSSQNI